MSFSILLSLTAQLMPVSTECAAALLSFRYSSTSVNTLSFKNAEKVLKVYHKIQPRHFKKKIKAFRY